MADYRRTPYNRQGCCQQQEPVRRAMPSGMPGASCSSPDKTPGFSDNFPLAMAYVPWQQWNQTYELDRALSAATIFPELDKPFRGVRKKGGCGK